MGLEEVQQLGKATGREAVAATDARAFLESDRLGKPVPNGRVWEAPIGPSRSPAAVNPATTAQWLPSYARATSSCSRGSISKARVS
jgi:hypothetical protein